jgi:hypothetical protein
MTAMQTVGVGQEAIVIELNKTIDTLRRDLILKDEIIKKLETGQNKDVALPNKSEPAVEPVVEQKDGLSNLLQRPTTTTKSAVVAPPTAGSIIKFTVFV